MFCCGNCFESQTLKKHIAMAGEINNCAFCGSRRVKCVEIAELYELFLPIFGLYREIEYGIDYFEDDDPLDFGGPLPDLIEEDWHPIFSDKFDHHKRDDLWRKLIKQDHYDKDNPPVSLSSLWVERGVLQNHPYDMWGQLSDYLKTERRFFIADESLIASLHGLPEILNRASSTIPAGERLFRARIGSAISKVVKHREKRVPFKRKEMGAPPPAKASSGRANPAGIPFLYLATDLITAISEVRPWKGAHVSVGRFRTSQNIEVIDLSAKYVIDDPFAYEDSDETYGLAYAIKENALLRHLGSELATPIDPDRSLIDYVPTQFLTELIRNEGYGGIKYPSAMADGKNVVLFGENLVSCTSVQLHQIDSVQYDYS